MNAMNVRRLPCGAEIIGNGVHFRVWAPALQSVEVAVGPGLYALDEEEAGYFAGLVPGIGAGASYQLRLNGSELVPDPVSRFQPDGPHGPSQVVDPSAFRWTDEGWRGIGIEESVIYEMHIGTFTPEGTWRAAAEHLTELQDLGVNVLEVMPVADFSGRWGWGYDGVNMYAPTRLYGTPDDFRAFVSRAHQLGIAVILDVVYNHLGADGNYLGKLTRDYFSTTYTTDWGDALNFDGPGAAGTREYFIHNAGYWIDEFHLDGLRVDATQNIYDKSRTHVLSEVVQQVRKCALGRRTIVIAENEPQETNLVRSPDCGGYGMDGLWNDDFHHSALVAMTARNEAYYTDYLGKAQEFVSALKYGYLYQGQYYKWQKHRRGTPAFDLPPHVFITFLENHDQVANSARGDRLPTLTSPGLLRAMTALVLLGPGTPMLFQGQEFGSTKPFMFFADMPEWLADSVRNGRREFVGQWRSLKTPELVASLADPCAPETFEACKLDRTERERNGPTIALHRDLLRLRREDPVISQWSRSRFDGAVLSDSAFVFRIFSAEHGDRLLLVNLGRDLHRDPAPEPLLAPPESSEWQVLFSTEAPQYGGCGTAPPDTEQNWRIPGWSAILLRPVATTDPQKSS
ncbi:MAG TPA: malto-oligosyltrehalose trehalohydrolase [Bryobacteraceae bacterium]|nr:malto-oligosyltrehalose trehalohydrolase [Bryobacteraceae bacterium]